MGLPHSIIGCWCNGSIAVSKTVGQGSNPWRPVQKIFLDFFIKILYNKV